MSALLAISVGNTRTSFARFVDRKLIAAEHIENTQENKILDGICQKFKAYVGRFTFHSVRNAFQ